MEAYTSIMQTAIDGAKHANLPNMACILFVNMGNGFTLQNKQVVRLYVLVSGASH